MYLLWKILFKGGGVFRKICVKLLSTLEGGEFRSTTLRRLYERDKGIVAGIGSYGWTAEGFKGPAIIGNYCSFGQGLKRFEKNHIMSGITTHPCWFNPDYGWCKKDPREKNILNIGHDVWIGDNVIITPNCKDIGTGAIIAAGSVVTKSIPPYEIWGGVPARKIKDRFDEDMKRMLLNSEWWDVPEDTLKTYSLFFYSPEIFLKYVNNNYRANELCKS